MTLSEDKNFVQSERVQRLTARWEGLRQGDEWPLRKNLHPEMLVDLLPNIVITEVERASGHVLYRLVGTMVVEMSRIDFTGRWLHEMHPAVAEPSIWETAYRRIIETGKPVFGRTGIPIEMESELVLEEEFGIFPLSINDPNRFQCVALEDYGDLKHVDPTMLRAMSPRD